MFVWITSIGQSQWDLRYENGWLWGAALKGSNQSWFESSPSEKCQKTIQNIYKTFILTFKVNAAAVDNYLDIETYFQL